MAPRVRTPSREWLTDQISRGLNDRQMADLWFEQSGELVTPQAINRRVREWDLRPRGDNYADVIPWEVKAVHAGHWFHKLLYAEGHLRHGKPVSARWRTSLANFKQKLRDEDAVVVYLPDTKDGFHRVQRKPGDDEMTTTRGREGTVTPLRRGVRSP